MPKETKKTYGTRKVDLDKLLTFLFDNNEYKIHNHFFVFIVVYVLLKVIQVNTELIYDVIPEIYAVISYVRLWAFDLFNSEYVLDCVQDVPTTHSIRKERGLFVINTRNPYCNVIKNRSDYVKPNFDKNQINHDLVELAGDVKLANKELDLAKRELKTKSAYLNELKTSLIEHTKYKNQLEKENLNLKTATFHDTMHNELNVQRDKYNQVSSKLDQAKKSLNQALSDLKLCKVRYTDLKQNNAELRKLVKNNFKNSAS